MPTPAPGRLSSPEHSGELARPASFEPIRSKRPATMPTLTSTRAASAKSVAETFLLPAAARAEPRTPASRGRRFSRDGATRRRGLLTGQLLLNFLPNCFGTGFAVRRVCTSGWMVVEKSRLRSRRACLKET